jgi:hypothetical protein
MSSLPGRLEPSQENAFDTATTDAVDHRRLRTRQLGTTLPPLDALWSFRRREATDTNVLKAMRASIVWRGADAWDALRIAARYSRWVRVPVLVSRALLAEGKDARRRFGRSLPGQAADVTRVATVNGLTPDEYYAAGLARYGGGDEILHYLPFDLIRACAYRLSGSWLDRIKDKLLFERTCRAAGLRVVRTITIFPSGTSKDETIAFKRGAATIAVHARVPLVPAFFQGPKRVQARHLLRRPVVRVTFGSPIPTAAVAIGKQTTIELTRQLEAEVGKLRSMTESRLAAA